MSRWVGGAVQMSRWVGQYRLAGGWGSTDEQVGGAVQISGWVGQYRLAGVCDNID